MAEAKKRTRKPRAQGKGLAEPRKPLPHEAACFDTAKEKWDERPKRVAVSVTVNDTTVVEPPHDDGRGFYHRMAETFGTTSDGFLNRSLQWLTSQARTHGKTLTEDEINAALAVVSAVDPKNEIEAMLGMQMFAAHDLAMNMSARLKQANNIMELEAYSAIATKMQRTFTTQLDTLTKLRRGGEQIIKYVHVHEGGQAVIGSTINQGGGGNAKEDGQSHAAAAIPQCAALPSPNEEGSGVPLPLDAKREVSHARRDEPRGTEGQ